MKQIRNTMLLIGGVFAAIGLFFLIFGAVEYSVCDRLMTEGVNVQGTAQWRGSDDLWISFEAEGQRWEVESFFHSDSIRSGDEITVWYMSGDPMSARMTDWWTYGIFLIMGGIFAAIGLGFILWQVQIIMLERSLRENGQTVQAEVIEVKQIRSIRINSRSPYVIYAVCTHPYTGSEMNVKSRLLMDDPRPHLTAGKVTVMVDGMNEKRYHVLTDELKNTEKT